MTTAINIIVCVFWTIFVIFNIRKFIRWRKAKRLEAQISKRGVRKMVVDTKTVEAAYKAALDDIRSMMVENRLDEKTYVYLCNYAKMVYDQQTALNVLMTDNAVKQTTLQFMADDLFRYSTVLSVNGLGGNIHTEDRDTIIEAYAQEARVEVEKKMRIGEKS